MNHIFLKSLETDLVCDTLQFSSNVFKEIEPNFEIFQFIFQLLN
jgi:hypothetical protein